MKKTLNVNIGNRPFVIDEDAYLTLKHYLDEIDIRLDGQEQGEVMEDIENRIADLFQESLTMRIQVVTLEVVLRVIAIIGSAQEFGEPRRPAPGGGEAGQQDATARPAPAGGQVPEKRFYRSRYDRVLGGVCGGISNYFDIDLTLVRILAVAAIPLTGIAVLFYLALWIAMPMEPPRITSGNNQTNL